MELTAQEEKRAPARQAEPRRVAQQPSPVQRDRVVCVDFDGVLAHYSGHRGPGVLGEPLPNGMKLLRELKKQGYAVVILTARQSSELPAVQAWLDANGVGFAKATNRKIPSAAYVDDRAVNWDGFQSTDKALREVEAFSRKAKWEERSERK